MDSVETPSLLFERARVPKSIVMNDVPTESMQINSFTHHSTADKYLREKRAVEGLGKPVAYVRWSITKHHADK